MIEHEVYFDDSGTHRESPIAVAACYIAEKSQWDSFVKDWDGARERRGFDVFHMADFSAKPERGCKPFCDWDRTKRQIVYEHLVSIIKTRAAVGLAISVPKDEFDEEVPEFIKERHGKNHYTFAVRCLMGAISLWRSKFGHHRPMQYVFDRMTKGKGEIDAIWGREFDKPPDGEDWLELYGMTKDGYSFQSREVFKALQASDIFAWQMYNHMTNVIIPGKDELKNIHPNFRFLRERPGTVYEVGFFERYHFKNAIQGLLAQRDGVEGRKYIIPWLADGGKEP
jgi:hypothetical protein